VNVTSGGSSSSSIAFFSSSLVSGFVTLLNMNGWELEQFMSHLVRTAKTRCKQTEVTTHNAQRDIVYQLGDKKLYEN
jgi:hypothetical protein